MPPSPTETELELLKLFWRDGALSAREVQDRLPTDLDWAGSTTRTVLERMRAKGLLTRKSVHGMAVYGPARPKVEVLGAALRRVMRDVLEVKGPLPAAAFTGSHVLTREELDELVAILNADAEAAK
jgi:predicted transcriptional regulator